MIAIITARGGSKGLPRKNVLPFCGKPLIAHTIEAALRSEVISRVVVSTDDEEIAERSLDFGAEVPFMRPEYLSTDTATSRDAVLHALDFLEHKGTLDSFCLLQPTSPLRTALDIDLAADLFFTRSASSILSVVEYEHPIQWALKLDESGRMAPLWENQVQMRQEASSFYRPNGAIYIFNTRFFKTSESYFGNRSYAYIMPPVRSVDIDTRLDFMIAEAIASYLKENGHDG